MTRDEHAEISRHLEKMLNTAQGKIDAETGNPIDLGHEVFKIRQIIDCYVRSTCPHGYPQTVRCSRCGK